MPTSQKSAATTIAAQLKKAGYLAYFVGGSVRDDLLGIPPKDYDIATDATPEQIVSLFPKTESIGAHFGVILVKHDGQAVEVATFRTDGSYGDGRRPDQVEFSTPEEDAQRRDFTINGLFFDPVEQEIIDFVGGREDLEKRLIRAIGKASDRFEEDALRLMRAIRFATHTGFQIEAEIWQAIQNFAPTLDRISIERVQAEFSKIMLSPNRARGFQLLADSGLFAVFMPEVLDLIGCEQPPQWHPEGDVFVHTRIMLELLDPNASLELSLAVLLHDIGKPGTRSFDEEQQRIRFNGHDALGAEMAVDILTRLKYPNQTIALVEHMVARHMQFMNVMDMRTAKLKRFMAPECFEQEMELHRVDCASSNGFTENYDFLRQKQEEFANEPIIPEPFVTGRDLIDRGHQPGPAFKNILEAIQTEQLEGRISSRTEAISFLEKEFIAP